jgi:hypothetical protein
MPESPAIRVLDAAEPDLIARLGEEISAFNFDATAIRDGRVVFARVDGADGGLAAAIHGWTWGGTGWVEHLWGSPWLDAATATRMLGTPIRIAS